MKAAMPLAESGKMLELRLSEGQGGWRQHLANSDLTADQLSPTVISRPRSYFTENSYWLEISQSFRESPLEPRQVRRKALR
jgi:hypothetical protein